MKKYIAYYRVSTAKQGQSGLGLQAQQAAVAGFVKKEDTIIKELVEIESGKRDDRPELAVAIGLAKQRHDVAVEVLFEYAAYGKTRKFQRISKADGGFEKSGIARRP